MHGESKLRIQLHSVHAASVDYYSPDAFLEIA